ncbi:sensor histidine kinase [Persicimonas caeni]|nr:HAMP domain-containing sensor histidine kinase [Persicimonas caeni]
MDEAVMVIDDEARELVFINVAARDLAASAGIAATYEAVSTRVLPREGAETAGDSSRMCEIELDGRVFSCSIQNECGPYRVVLLRDETDRRRLEQLAASVNTTEHIDRVFAGIRHEIGNPINALKMTLTVLQRNLERFDREAIVEYVERSLTDVARVEYLLRSLRNFNMVEDPEPEQLDLADFLAQFLALAAGDFPSITHHVDADARVVRADPRALQQILINLLSNASDAIEDVDEPRIEIRAGRDGERVVLEVSDNGQGMDEETLQKLFEPFFTTKQKGTGLGMVIVQKMMARMGGEVGVQSHLGQGTTFTLQLPAV